MKMFGMILVLLAVILIGLMRINRLQKHYAQLQALFSMTEQISRQIRYTNHELKSILLSLEESSKCQLPFLSRVVLNTGISLENAFKTTPGLALSEEEQAAVLEFLKGFGRTDRTDQISRCERLNSFLEERISQEQKQLPQQIRMISTLSFCGGAALALILL